MSAAVGTKRIRQDRLTSLRPGGAVEGGTPFRLYYLIAESRASGCLTLTDANQTAFELTFRRGTPVYARTSSPALGIGRYLLAQGILDQEALAKAQALLLHEGGDLIGALCRSSGMEPSEAFGHLAGYGRAILVRALAIESGTFAWTADAPAPEGAAPLGEAWPLAGLAVRRIGGADIVRRLGERFYLPIMRAGDGSVTIEDLGLGTQEARAVTYFDGTRSLAQIAAAGNPDDGEAIFRTGYFLWAIGMASFASDRAGVRPSLEEDAPRPPTIARFSSGPVAEELPPADPELAAILAELPSKDHFGVLGLERTAGAAEIKKAYFRLARLYHPDTAGPGNEGARRAKEQITSRLNEAYEILGSDRRREEYLAELDAREDVGAVDVASILEAEKRFQEAVFLVRARKFKEALAELDKAIDLNDSEGEFHAWRAFARFSATADKREVEQECRAELARALEQSPNCATIWLFSGRISNVLGDIPGAIEAYKACLALEKGNVEAMRELRLIEARKVK